MARYIDAEKIVFWIRHVSKDGLEDDVRKIAFSDEIARMPTADVAPRAEVAREIFEETMRAMESGIAEADKAVINNISVGDFRESLCRAGEMYAGYIGMAICKVFQKYAEDGK